MALESNNKNVRVVACIVRPNMDIDLGLALRQDDSKGCLIVESVDPNGLFAKTGIAVNQILVKIMGKNCSNRSRNKLEKALEVLQNAKGLITLETESTAAAADDYVAGREAVPTYDSHLNTTRHGCEHNSVRSDQYC